MLICPYLGYRLPYLDIRGFSTLSLFFFMAGAWFSVTQKNVTVELGKLGYWPFILYPLIALVDLCTKEESYNIYINKIGILVGIVFCFNLVSRLLNAGKIKTIGLLSSASFFVFAIHDPWLLSQIKKILFKLFRPESDIMLTFLYFAIVAIVVIVALVIYYFLKRIFPRFTTMITGGR